MARKTSNKPPAEQKRQAEAVHVRQWVGPLPSPGDLSAFDAVVENGAERIVQQWERETSHRHKIERRELWLYAVNSVLGRVFAFVFVMGALATSAYMASIGAHVAASLIGGGTLAGVAWAFKETRRR